MTPHDIRVTEHGHTTVVQTAGTLDGRLATEFEQRTLEVVQQGCRALVVDVTHTTMLSGQGLRVLVLLLDKLSAVDGELVLCGLSVAIQRVLQIANLTDRFVIVPTLAEATARLAARRPTSTGTVALARRAVRLLGLGETVRPVPAPAGSPPPETIAALGGQVVGLLERAETRARATPPPSS